MTLQIMTLLLAVFNKGTKTSNKDTNEVIANYVWDYMYYYKPNPCSFNLVSYLPLDFIISVLLMFSFTAWSNIKASTASSNMQSPRADMADWQIGLLYKQILNTLSHVAEK